MEILMTLEKDIITKDVLELKIYNANNIKGNISLRTLGEHGSEIIWESSHPDIIKGSKQSVDYPKSLGWVTRPKEDTKVTLTATVSKGAEKTSKTFNLVVKKSVGKLDYKAYFFSYFTGEYEGGEEISFATAKEPLKWRALNNGKSIIQSAMGEKGLRDPFIMRSPEGDKFYLLATDLKMGEGTNFDQAQITGSRFLMVWESDDLVNWSKQRMVEVAPKKAGNTWAPEAFYDEKTGDYLVFWASSMKVQDTYGKYPEGRPAGQYNLIYYATTRDFHTFSEPKVYIDEGFPTIDTTMIKNGDTLYRFTKSEVNMKVYYEKADNVFYDRDGIAGNGYQFDLIEGTRDGDKGTIGHAGNNEGQTVFKDINQDKWYLFLDSWPYHVRTSTDLEDGSQFKENLLEGSDYALPPGPRHGTVMPITQEEYDALQKRYGVEGPRPSEDPVLHYRGDERDLSGKGHHGQLNKTTGLVEMPKNIIKTLNLEKMTIALWIKVEKNLEDQRVFEFSAPTGRTKNRNTMYLSTQGNSGELEFAIITPFSEKFEDEWAPLGKDYKYALRAPKLALNTWHHVAVSIDGFNAALYVNGKEVAKNPAYNIEPRMLLETPINTIAQASNGNWKDFRIYNRALRMEELSYLAKMVP